MTTSPLLDPLDHVFTDQQKHQDAHDSRGALPQRDTLSPAELLPGMTSCVKQKRKLFLGRLPAAVAWFGLLRPVIGVSHRGCRDRSGNKVPVPFRQTLKPISSLEHTKQNAHTRWYLLLPPTTGSFGPMQSWITRAAFISVNARVGYLHWMVVQAIRSYWSESAFAVQVLWPITTTTHYTSP